MSRTVNGTGPRTDPEIISGGVRGDIEPTPAIVIAQLHTALQKAVDVFGGVVALAESMGKRLSDVSQRVRRAQDANGDIQRASLDIVGHCCAGGTARQCQQAFLESLCDQWNFRRPEARREPTLEEKYQALLGEVESSGAVGAGIKERAAARAGFETEAFRR